MANDIKQCMILNLKGIADIVSTDWSKDVDMKLYPIVSIYLDKELSKVVNCLLSVPNLEGK